MRHYELVTILSPMLNQEDASATWDEIKSFIVNREGEITAEQTWGTRRLAYPIRKGNYNFLEGAYYLSSFAVDNPFNRELENYLRLHDNVLRALVVRCDGPLAERPEPGPLTAPSRYIPPGRGRRNDGGGPIPEAPASAMERGANPPSTPFGGAAPATPPETTAAAPDPVPVPDAASAPSPDPAPVAEAAVAPASAEPPSTEPDGASAVSVETSAPADSPPPEPAPAPEASPPADPPAPEPAPATEASAPADPPAPDAAPAADVSDSESEA